MSRKKYLKDRGAPLIVVLLQSKYRTSIIFVLDLRPQPTVLGPWTIQRLAGIIYSAYARVAPRGRRAFKDAYTSIMTTIPRSALPDDSRQPSGMGGRAHRVNQRAGQRYLHVFWWPIGFHFASGLTMLWCRWAGAGLQRRNHSRMPTNATTHVTHNSFCAASCPGKTHPASPTHPAL